MREAVTRKDKMNPVGEGFTEVVGIGRVLRQNETGVGLGILSGGTA